MPKNTKKAKNAKNTNNTAKTTRELILKTDDQEYARASKMLGNSRITCECFDNKERLCVIRNKMRRGRRNRITEGDIVLITLRDFQDDKADIIHVYNTDEVKKLKKICEIPDDIEDKQEDVFEFNENEDVNAEINLENI